MEERQVLEALAGIFRKTQMYIGINPVCCTTSTFPPRWSISQSVCSFHCRTFNGNQWSLRSTNRRPLFIFLLHLVAVIVVLVFFFLAVLSSQLITLQVILQISDTLPVIKRVCSGCDKNNISIIDQQLFTAAGFIVWSSMVKLYRKINIKRYVMIYSVQSMKS